MEEYLVCYKAHKGFLAGQVLVYQYVDSLFGDEVEALIQKLTKEGYQDLKALTLSEYEELANEALIQVYKVDQAQEIDEQYYNEMFNILPPQDYFKSHDYQCFRTSEQLDLGYYNYFAKIGTKHFKVVMNRIDANVDRLFNICNGSVPIV